MLWMVRNEQNGIVRLLTVVILLLRVRWKSQPWASINLCLELRQRGVQFGGLGIRGGGPTDKTGVPTSLLC
jgi:hypothetical protein